MGVKFVTNFIVGMTESIEDLKREGFKGFMSLPVQAYLIL